MSSEKASSLTTMSTARVSASSVACFAVSCAVNELAARVDRSITSAPTLSREAVLALGQVGGVVRDPRGLGVERLAAGGGGGTEVLRRRRRNGWRRGHSARRRSARGRGSRPWSLGRHACRSCWAQQRRPVRRRRGRTPLLMSSEGRERDARPARRSGSTLNSSIMSQAGESATRRARPWPDRDRQRAPSPNAVGGRPSRHSRAPTFPARVVPHLRVIPVGQAADAARGTAP